MQFPLGSLRIERPHLGVLLTAATLIVAAVANHSLPGRIPHAGSLVTKPRRWRGFFQRAELDPSIRGEVIQRRLWFALLGNRALKKQGTDDDRQNAAHENSPNKCLTSSPPV